MQTEKDLVFRLRVLVIGKAVTVFLIGCTAGLAVFFGVLKTEILPEWSQHQIGTVILVLVILLVFVLAKNWATVPALFVLTRNGLEVFFRKPRRVFEPLDRAIFWNDLVEWQHEPEHVSAHSFSPPTFKIKLADGRKIRWMMADGEHTYALFLQHFEQKLRQINQKNASIGQIRREPEFAKSAAGFWFLSAVAALIFGLGSWLFFVPIRGERVLDLGGYALISGMSFFVFWLGFFARRRGKREST